MKQLKVGEAISGGKYIVADRISCIKHMVTVLKSDDIVYWRHRVFPTAFFRHWSIAMLEAHIKGGAFYQLYRNSNFNTTKSK